tara:strand:+ start:874 stop:1002 length:129 start_codon:yes stop_codon:yes gene_type:complete
MKLNRGKIKKELVLEKELLSEEEVTVSSSELGKKIGIIWRYG